MGNGEGVCFYVLNVQGLVGKSYNKLYCDEVKNIFKTNNIVLFTETWSNSDFNYEVDGFTCYALHRTLKLKNSRRDSGGLIIYVANHFVSDDILLKTVDDCVIWLKVAGKYFGLNDSLFLCLCYNIPTGSSREVFVQNNIFDIIADDMYYFENKFNNNCNFIVTGDMNSRVGTRADFVENEYLFHLNLLPDDYIEDVYLKRYSI